MGIRQQIPICRIVNQNVKILGRRLYSRSLKDAAALEVAELIFFSIHLSVNFFPANRVQTFVYPAKFTDNCMEKLEKLTGRLLSSQATSFKLGECNHLPSILTLRFRNCVKFNFGRSYLLLDAHTNSVISDHFAYPSRWRRKP